MLQWSPDTSPNRISGSGYSYSDSHISGFSLTHLSGTGCAAYGDVPILPTVGPIQSAPNRTADTFSHSHEFAAPGRYSVTLGPANIGVALTVTKRTGLADFTFPTSPEADLIFKVAGSANPVSQSVVDLLGDDQVVGYVTSGQFCQTGTPYTLYFAARFNRAFTSDGSWSGNTLSPAVGQCQGSACGAYVTFDATSDQVVKMKVGVSFVSVANAEANVLAEDPGWSLPDVERQATRQWNGLLGKIRIGGGTLDEQRTFYTAMYHSLLDPSVISDDNGEYMGDDHEVHYSGRVQYSNFSEWDIYRSEIQLLSLVAPQQTGDMIQSLVNDADQGGWLPKWAIADGDASQMNGDSADPIIADAYAFGVHNFDLQGALAAMVKGATQTETGHGFEIERQYLDQYLGQHYINAGSLDLSSIDYSIGGSATLEYALDDFSIAQFALAIGDQSVYQDMSHRADNWEYLFNPAAGYIEARNSNGSFPTGPAFQSDLFEAGGEKGFEEGNAIQYTWSVPQDLATLRNLMGGPARTVAKLNTFFTHLNSGRFEPFDWAGNEPSLWTPWEFDYFGAPWRTQEVVRQIVTSQYHDAPVDEPGNDDLGAISSWYVWASIGLYPVTPGTGNLELASPLFSEVSISLPSGHRLLLVAPGASADTPYISSLTIRGSSPQSEQPSPNTSSCTALSGSPHSDRTERGGSWDSPWIPASLLASGAIISFVLSGSPNRGWGSNLQNAPPSYTTDQLPAVGFSLPSGDIDVQVGIPATMGVGLQQVSIGSPGATWTAMGTAGITVTPASGVLGPINSASVASSTNDTSEALTDSCTSPSALHQNVSVLATTVGNGLITFSLRSATGVALPPVVVSVTSKTSPGAS